MEREVFLQACKLAADRCEYIAIGGGEPTMHPLFWDYIGLAIAYQQEGPPWMATNGKITETALTLARLARKGILSVELSRDQYHEDIDQDVITAFTIEKRSYIGQRSEDHRGIRDITQNGQREPIPQGRAKKIIHTKQTECACNDLFVAPNGDLYTCGCQNVRLGTVFDPCIGDEVFENSIDAGWCMTYR